MTVLLKRRMTLGQATEIIAPGLTSRGPSVFGQTSKMPGRSYGLPAAACKRGARLATDPRSMCHPSRCYAKRNFYKSYTPVIKNREAHLEAVRGDLVAWADAMVLLMAEYLRKDDTFRWHDSGDLQSADHLAAICDVAARTPWMRHWLPTHEPFIVRAYVQRGGTIPANLCIRISADRIGEAAVVPAELRGLVTTSTVHLDLGRPVPLPGGRRRDSVECRAHERDHQCLSCRACWSRDVASVSYPLSGTGGAEARAGRHQGRRQVHLPVVP